MKETEEKVVHKADPDEIDLGPIMNRVNRVLSSFNDRLRYSYKKIRYRFYIVVLAAAIGFAGGMLYFFTAPPIYKSSMSLTTKMLPLDFYADMIDDLNALISEGSSELLAEELSIDPGLSSQLAGISFDAVYTPYDSLLSGLPFKITVSAFSNNVFNDMEPALVNYLENHQYNKRRKESAERYLKEMKVRINAEMQELDSLKKIYKENMVSQSTNAGFIYGEPLDPLDVYREKIGLYDRVLKIESELAFIDNVELISGFIPTAKPDSPKLLKSAGIGLLAGLIFGVLITLFIPAPQEHFHLNKENEM